MNRDLNVQFRSIIHGRPTGTQSAFTSRNEGFSGNGSQPGCHGGFLTDGTPGAGLTPNPHDRPFFRRPKPPAVPAPPWV